jgi:transcriptional regulator with XRE-family HTH domain
MNLDLLKSVIKAQGYTIAGLAAATGLNRSTLGKKLSGKGVFRRYELIAIIPLLNLCQDFGKEIFFPEEPLGKTADVLIKIGLEIYGFGRKHREAGREAFTFDQFTDYVVKGVGELSETMHKMNRDDFYPYCYLAGYEGRPLI